MWANHQQRLQLSEREEQLNNEDFAETGYSAESGNVNAAFFLLLDVDFTGLAPGSSLSRLGTNLHTATE